MIRWLVGYITSSDCSEDVDIPLGSDRSSLAIT